MMMMMMMICLPYIADVSTAAVTVGSITSIVNNCHCKYFLLSIDRAAAFDPRLMCAV